MIKRAANYLTTRKLETVSEAAIHLEQEGYVVIKNALTDAELSQLRSEINAVFDEKTADVRNPYRTAEDDEMFRYEMFNRSQACLDCLTHPKILEVIEPLLGNDCHVIANTAWRNPAGYKPEGAFNWHVDGGPHIPLEENNEWPENIPHPVFAIGVHVFLDASGPDDGPTGVIPRSHLSGRFPPWNQILDDDLSYKGNTCVELLAEPGDVAFFVSDLWHRRVPTTKKDSGRYFLQIHYGRRDIAQRVRTTAVVSHVDETVKSKVTDERQQLMVGLHPPSFYDG